MGLEEYAGMTLEEKVTVMLVKTDNIENLIAAKPCPSPACLRCQQDISDLKEWKVKVDTEQAKEAKDEESKSNREAWFWPLMITSVLAIAALLIQIVSMF